MERSHWVPFFLPPRKKCPPKASRKIEETLEKIFKRQLRLECILDGQKDPTKEGPVQESVNLAEAAAEIF